MSEADRKQYNDYLDDIYNFSRDTLMNARDWSMEEFDAFINHDFMHSAMNALARNLVDYIGANNAVQAAIKEIEGNEIKDFYLYGDSSTSLTGSLQKYSAPKAKGSLFQRPPIIAVVHAEGQTDMEAGMSAAKLSKTVMDLADNRRVKAIVVRINSPGGSAEAAEHFARAIQYARQKKPVVVSMGQVAASGGYWAAINASHVMATPYTITGSIGVIGSWFYDNGLGNKLGFSIEVLKRGAHSDLMTGILLPYRNLNAQEEEQYKKYILDLYSIFIDKVAIGRGMERAEVETIAQGRIFSGTRALESGLIDSIGGLADALNMARTLAEIPEKTSVIYREYPEPKTFGYITG